MKRIIFDQHDIFYDNNKGKVYVVDTQQLLYEYAVTQKIFYYLNLEHVRNEVREWYFSKNLKMKELYEAMVNHQQTILYHEKVFILGLVSNAAYFITKKDPERIMKRFLDLDNYVKPVDPQYETYRESLTDKQKQIKIIIEKEKIQERETKKSKEMILEEDNKKQIEQNYTRYYPDAFAAQQMISLKSLQTANECLYFMGKSYKNMIEQFKNFSRNLKEKKLKEIEKQRTTILLDNTFIQFDNSFKEFPKETELRKALHSFLKKIDTDFQEFQKNCPSRDSDLQKRLEKFQNIIKGDGYLLSKKGSDKVESIDPKSLLGIFETIQRSYQESDQARNAISKAKEIIQEDFKSSWE